MTRDNTRLYCFLHVLVCISLAYVRSMRYTSSLLYIFLGLVIALGVNDGDNCATGN